MFNFNKTIKKNQKATKENKCLLKVTDVFTMFQARRPVTL